MFKLEFGTENAAFRDSMTGEFDKWCEAAEICRILDVVKEQISNGKSAGSIFDINGNRIGTWRRVE